MSQRGAQGVATIGNATGSAALGGYGYRAGMSINGRGVVANGGKPAIIATHVPGAGRHALLVERIHYGQVVMRAPSLSGR